MQKLKHRNTASLLVTTAATLACVGLLYGADATTGEAPTTISTEPVATTEPSIARASPEPISVRADPLRPLAVRGAPGEERLDGLLDSLIRPTDFGQMLDDLRIDLRGYLEVGYTYNVDGYQGQPYFGQIFTDERGNHLQVDQLALTAARIVDRTSPNFEIGGRIDLIYGFDTYRFHANGLDFYAGCVEENDGTEPFMQFDLTQAYVDLLMPVGRGLLVRAGKFVTPVGAESIDPTTTPFYSRSYLFGYASPFTHTGILANYPLDDARRLEFWAGIVTGWDQSLKDNNDRVSFLGELQYRVSDRLDMKVVVLVGPEDPEDCCDCPPDNAHYRTLVDGVIRYAASDRLTFAAEALAAYDGASDANAGSAVWYGAAAYASYRVNERVTLNGRAEWFFDGDGTRLGTEEDLNVYEATAGLTLTPFPHDRVLSNLIFRPEIRIDYADSPEFNGGRDHSQVTLGVDAIFMF